MKNEEVYRFGPFVLDLAQERLSRLDDNGDWQNIHVVPRAFPVLAHMVKNRHRMIDKIELWRLDPDNKEKDAKDFQEYKVNEILTKLRRNCGLRQYFESVRPNKIRVLMDVETSQKGEVVDIFSKYFHCGNQHAEAIRLIGADCETFKPEHIHISIDPRPYRMPLEILVERQHILERLEQDAKESGRVFFNGPHTRLVELRCSPRDGSEQKHLEMTFGPIGWHDFSIVNETYAKTRMHGQPEALKALINLQAVADGDIKHVQLTNIICTLTTIITSDGQALYTHRSGRVSAGHGLLCCSVAENIHAEKDRSLEAQKDDGLPAPFRTALRGIEEELCPKLLSVIHPGALMLLGVDFNLRNFHPDILFIAVVDMPADSIFKLVRESPGKDFNEGCRLSSVPIRLPLLSNQKLSTLLADHGWLPGAKASLIRAIEFVDAAKNRWKTDLRTTCQRLARGETDGLE